MHSDYKTLYTKFRGLECTFGLICFGLFIRYFRIADDSFVKDDVTMLAMYNFKTGIAYVAATGFPFLLQMPLIFAYSKHGLSFQHNILNPIVNLVGAVVYLTSGSLMLSWLVPAKKNQKFDVMDDTYMQQEAIAGMLVATGAVYFIDLIYWIVKLRREPE